METKRKIYVWRTVASCLLVLCAMPLGHALMIIMEKLMEPGTLHVAAFVMGFVGLVMVVIGVFAKGDTRQTLWGLFGGLLFWTGWVEFLFQYYADRYGVQPEIEHGVVVTRPEYLILPATFGLWVMVMMLYIFSTKNGCYFISWIQKVFMGKKRPEIIGRPMTRHSSIVTFMELMMILWGSYLLLMFCYDKRFIGDHNPITFLVGIGCLVGSVFMFIKELHIPSWGANIRMAIATIIVFWTPIEIMGRIDFLNEFWLHPQHYIWQMVVILIAFGLLGLYLWVESAKKHNRALEAEKKEAETTTKA